MNDHERLLLLHKKWTGSISPKELSQLEEQLSSDESFRKEAKWLENLWNKAAQTDLSFQPDTDMAWKKFRDRIHAAEKTARLFRMPRAWRVAATLALVIAAVGVVRLTIPSLFSETRSVASGKVSHKEITLRDGSVVLLNAFSELSYPRKFDGKERIVQLEGEAFFQVHADTEHPFFVQTPYGLVQVTGTKFNVRAFGKEGFEEVHVQSGVVSFQSQQDLLEKKLNPGETARLDKTSSALTVVPDSKATPLFWVNGKLDFKDTPLKNILGILEQYFRIQFKTDKIQPILNCTFTMSFSGLSLDESLEVLSGLTQTQVKPDTTKTVFSLSGGSCR